MPYTTQLAVLVALLGLTFVYRYLLPRPIPGIPYHKASSSNILGDVPRLLKFMKERFDVFEWLALQCTELKSPIVQVWTKPFQGPIVVLSDFQECQDILMRRTKEFDRAQFLEDIFYAIIPHATIRMKTTDTFKSQRRAFLETMSPTFVNSVAAEQVHHVTLSLIRLWQTKRMLANGHPFSGQDDIRHAMFDVIWAVTFGSHLGTQKAQLAKISLLKSPLVEHKDGDEPVEFPVTDVPPIYYAVESITNSVQTISSSPFPRVHHVLLCQTPKLRAARAVKDRMINEAVKSSLARFSTTASVEKNEVRSTMDVVLRQQAQLVGKGGAHIPDAALKDELLSFLMGGHDTTATTVTWALKYLTSHQQIQTRLRRDLDDAFQVNRSSAADVIAPPAQSIMETKTPYLDAVIEETLRVGRTASGISRVAMTDTKVMGHFVPKGTEIFCMNNGAAVVSPAIATEDESADTLKSGFHVKVGEWDPADIALFNPDRWLENDDSGKVAFNIHAGPNFPFSSGIRGCFGKRQAYAQLRIVLCLIILNFELQPLPVHLNTYDVELKMTREARQSFVRLGKIEA